MDTLDAIVRLCRFLGRPPRNFRFAGHKADGVRKECRDHRGIWGGAPEVKTCPVQGVGFFNVRQSFRSFSALFWISIFILAFEKKQIPDWTSRNFLEGRSGNDMEWQRDGYAKKKRKMGYVNCCKVRWEKSSVLDILQKSEVLVTRPKSRHDGDSCRSICFKPKRTIIAVLRARPMIDRNYITTLHIKSMPYYCPIFLEIAFVRCLTGGFLKKTFVCRA